MQNNTIKALFGNKSIVFLLLAAIVFCGVLCAMPQGVASAYNTYGGKSTSELWYYQEDCLNVENAKQLVESWDLSVITKPIVIAVIDTGIYASHEIFNDVLMTNASGGILGYNSVNKPDEDGKVNISDDDENGHGTAVSATIAMLIKEFGLEKYIKLYTIKANVLDDNKISQFTINTLSDALNWAVSDNNVAKADVINMSLGFAESVYEGKEATAKNKLEQAIENARAQATIVAAAGNNSKENELYYPAVLPGVVSVMNQQSAKELYSSSNYGSKYSLCAPGTNIYTANKLGGYTNASGTSQAAAITSFASALLKLRLMSEGRASDAQSVAKIIQSIPQNTVSKNKQSFMALDLLSVVQGDTAGLAEYSKPTSIELLHDGTMGSEDYADSIYMLASNVEEIAFSARVLPVGDVDVDVLNSVEWYCVRLNADGEEAGEPRLIGSGTSIKYTPEQGGSYNIYAALPSYGLKSEPQWLYVKFADYFVGEVRVTLAPNANDDADVAPSSQTIYTNETTKFALTGVQYLDPDVETSWYVNDELVATGAVFSFKPTKSGTYVISAKYGDRSVEGSFCFTAEVKAVIVKPLYLSLLIVGCVLVVAAATCGAIFAARKKKAKAAETQDSQEPSED